MTEAQKDHAVSKLMDIAAAVKGQAALARLMGCSRTTVSDIKSSRKIPLERVLGDSEESRGLVSIGRENGVEVDLSDLRPDIWQKWHTYEAPKGG